jgi:hypothetical protein
MSLAHNRHELRYVRTGGASAGGYMYASIATDGAIRGRIMERRVDGGALF